MCEYSDDTGYECPYKKLDDSDYCIFHLQDDNKDVYEFNKEIKEILDEEKDEDLINLNGFYFPSESSDFSGQIFQNKIDFHNVIFSGNTNFEGTEFSKADFSEATFSVNANFRGAKFSKADFKDADFSKGANFSGANFSGFTNFEKVDFSKAIFSGAEFSDNANFRGTKFSKADFNDVDFSKDANFSGANFSGFANFVNAEFSGYANFKNAKFTGDVNFWNAEFSEKAYFENAKFTGCANFWNAEFSEDVYFMYAKFIDMVNFRKATFSRDINFRKTTFSGEPNFREADFSETTFSGESNFSETTFLGKANFRKSTFSREANFRKAIFSRQSNFMEADFSETTFSGKTSFEDATFSGNANFERAELTGKFEFIPDKSEIIIFKKTYFSDNIRIKADMSKCSFANSNIERVDMTDSVWITDNKPKNLYSSLIESLKHKMGMSETSIEIWEECQGDFSSMKELESIYRRLKQSFQKFGDNSTAGKLYYREMECKRKQSRGWKKRWYAVYKISCGYGESPLNVVLLAGIIIFLSSLGFFYGGIELLGSAKPINYDVSFNIPNFLDVGMDWLECFYTSVITFTTLGYGDVHPIGYSRIVASIEAGLGIFLTALFIFVFTRKMSR